MTGRVLRVIRGRACGFIRAANGQDVFFHASDLHRLKLDDLEESPAVQFHLVADAVSGPRAIKVRKSIDRRAR
jgi:cold shock CspA family protein